MPPRGIAQGGAQKSGNTRSKIARGLAQLSWCHIVPLAVQQKGCQICPRFVVRFRCHANPRRGTDSCTVTAIDFPGRRDLRGSLHPEIGKLTELNLLDLSDTDVSGSLEVLANNTKLGYLQLRHTRVMGRLEDLPKARRLLNLDLTGTEVTGDLAALPNFRKLLYLRLSNTAVSGELKSLAKLKWLGELDLSNTAVSGELKSLPKMERLTKLELANLKVVGDAAVMEKWSGIEHIDLSGTRVWFNLFRQFEPYNDVTVEWLCPLPALRFLDVSSTSRFSLAQHFLRAFAGCGKLATLKAAGCGLSGPLWPVILDPWGNAIPIGGFPLNQALRVLDLGSNNVTYVAKLPRSCRTLVLTGNPDVSFGAGLMEKAIKEMVFIDLRNATFGNPSDALLLIG